MPGPLIIDVTQDCTICFLPCMSFLRPCGHGLHRKCYAKWDISCLSKKNGFAPCPECRGDVTAMSVPAAEYEAVKIEMGLMKEENVEMKSEIRYLKQAVSEYPKIVKDYSRVNAQIVQSQYARTTACTLMCNDVMVVVAAIVQEIESLKAQIANHLVTEEIGASSLPGAVPHVASEMTATHSVLLNEIKTLRRSLREMEKSVREKDACYKELCALLDRRAANYRQVLRVRTEQCQAEAMARDRQISELRSEVARLMAVNDAPSSPFPTDVFASQPASLSSMMLPPVPPPLYPFPSRLAAESQPPLPPPLYLPPSRPAAGSQPPMPPPPHPPPQYQAAAYEPSPPLQRFLAARANPPSTPPVAMLPNSDMPARRASFVRRMMSRIYGGGSVGGQ